MILRHLPRCLAFMAGMFAAAGPLVAQDNSTLLNLLVRKGILTEQEADDLRSDLAKENVAALVSTSRANNLERFALTARFQSQFVDLDTATGGSVTDPANVQHFFLRRIYFGARAQFSANWSTYFNYDFAGSTFDQATITWRKSDQLVVDFGLRKVPFGYGPYSLVAEYYWADNERGALLTRDAKPSGFWIQPSIRFGQLEPTFRYSYTDSDGRGVVPGDLVRSAPNPAGLTFDKIAEWYGGVNWYPVGNDLRHEVKVQAGYIYAESTDRLTGPATVSKLKTDGFRSQVQVNF